MSLITSSAQFFHGTAMGEDERLHIKLTESFIDQLYQVPSNLRICEYGEGYVTKILSQLLDVLDIEHPTEFISAWRAEARHILKDIIISADYETWSYNEARPSITGGRVMAHFSAVEIRQMADIRTAHGKNAQLLNALADTRLKAASAPDIKEQEVIREFFYGRNIL